MAALALAQYGSGAAITALLHPLGYAKVLMQVGHEPLPPVPSTTLFFRKEILINPNIFKYIGHIKSVDGFFGLYRGVVPRVLAGTIGNIVQYNVMDKIKSKADKSKEAEEECQQGLDGDVMQWATTVAKETAEDSLVRCCGVIVSHPFHVVMVRCMVQFIGKETQYDSMWSSIKEIYRHDGILGFFAGLVPRLIGEVITIWATSYLTHAIHKYLMPDKEMRDYTSAACGLVVGNFTYPFTLVTNIMAVNGSGLKGGEEPLMPLYSNWLSCFAALRRDGDLKRGASAFWRVYKTPSGPSFPPQKMSQTPLRRFEGRSYKSIKSA